MSNKFSYVKIINRDACTSCGNHTRSHVPWWPDDEIHLFMGIPLCWSCITKMVFQWEKMKVRERSGIDNETYGRYMMDIENEVDKLNEKVNTGGGVYKTRMEDLFARECVKHSTLRVIDLKNEKGWFDHIVEGMSKDADQYKGVLFQTKLVVDEDYFKQGTPLFIEWIEGTLPDIKGTESFAMIDSVVSDGIWVIGDSFGSTGYKITIEHLMSDKIWIRKCIVPEGRINE